MRKRKLTWIVITIFLLGMAFFVQQDILHAEEKKIVVVEKSENEDDETNHEHNKENLPSGATAVEAGDLATAETRILGQLGEGDCIKELHFRGHGKEGVQSVGDGIHSDDAKHINSNQWETDLADLKNKFCENATIHLWGCNSGACDEGAEKLKKLADFFGVTAKGAVNEVTAGEQNEYTGPIQTATPDKPKPACIPAEDEKADAADGRQEGEMQIDTGIPLVEMAYSPGEIIIDLNMENVISYSETINFPTSFLTPGPLGPATPNLIDLTASIAFSPHPDPNLISYNIESLEQTLESFDVYGIPTGINTSTLSTNYVSSGTININTGEVSGSATVVHSNDLISILVPNDVRGIWYPTYSSVVNLTFSGPAAVPEPLCEFEFSLPEGWSMISIPVLLENAILSEIFPDAVVVYGYEKESGYKRIQNNEELEAGKGYWILLHGPQSYNLTGQIIFEYTNTVNETGWKMIGGCTFPAQATTDSCNIVVIYRYTQGVGYQRVLEKENLLPGKGYWILFRDVADQCDLTVQTENIESSDMPCQNFILQ